MWFSIIIQRKTIFTQFWVICPGLGRNGLNEHTAWLWSFGGTLSSVSASDFSVIFRHDSYTSCITINICRKLLLSLHYPKSYSLHLCNPGSYSRIEWETFFLSCSSCVLYFFNSNFSGVSDWQWVAMFNQNLAKMLIFSVFLLPLFTFAFCDFFYFFSLSVSLPIGLWDKGQFSFEKDWNWQLKERVWN